MVRVSNVVSTAIAVLGVVACGTVKPNSNADDAGSIDATDGSMDAAVLDAPPDAPPQFSSCIGLAATCGAAANENCCATATVPGGTYYRSYDVSPGSSYKDMGAPATVSTFKLDKFEVTVGRFRVFVNAGYGTQAKPPAPGAGTHPALPESGWDPAWNQELSTDISSLVAGLKCDASYQSWTDAAGATDNRPINCVTWYEAMAFCIWDGGYLPTEAEWNYAAAGGAEQRAFPWSNPAGDVSIDCSYANHFPASSQPCAPGVNRVGSESPKGDGKWGHSDLAGNVAELVLDSYAPYVTPCTDCAPTIGGNRVVRGGSTLIDPAFVNWLRTADRFIGVAPNLRRSTAGVRCARIP